MTKFMKQFVQVLFMNGCFLWINTAQAPNSLITVNDHDEPFNYSFIDDDIATQYKSYTRWMAITGVATIMAIVIAGLGCLV